MSKRTPAQRRETYLRYGREWAATRYAQAKARGEHPAKTKCGLCGERGHNRRLCVGAEQTAVDAVRAVLGKEGK